MLFPPRRLYHAVRDVVDVRAVRGLGAVADEPKNVGDVANLDGRASEAIVPARRPAPVSRPRAVLVVLPAVIMGLVLGGGVFPGDILAGGVVPGGVVPGSVVPGSVVPGSVLRILARGVFSGGALVRREAAGLLGVVGAEGQVEAVLREFLAGSALWAVANQHKPTRNVANVNACIARGALVGAKGAGLVAVAVVVASRSGESRDGEEEDDVDVLHFER